METQKAEILLAVHRAHKEELMYRRRMEYLTMALCLLFFIGTAAFLLLTARPHFAAGSGLKCLGTIVLALVADMICYALVKNYHRMCELQRVIVSIDLALGLFTPGAFAEGRAVYPEEWKKSGGKRFWGAPSRVLVVVILTVIAALTLWARMW